MRYEADVTYVTDTSRKDSLLGRGGCFTQVERSASKTRSKTKLGTVAEII